MENEPKIYEVGNPWEKQVYSHLADYLLKKGVTKFGETTNGNQYKHWLTESDANMNFITTEIHDATLARFNKHKAGDLKRILTNTAASQTYCFNLIIHLQQNPLLADKLFSDLLGKQVKVLHLEPEFTPNECNSVTGFDRKLDESIGDQNHKLGIGTDSDIAVFYNYDNAKKGVLLIEFKFIEPEFSVCSSFAKKPDIRSTCNSGNYFAEYIVAKGSDKANNFFCGYKKYYNWQLTEKSKVVDGSKIRLMAGCPFRYGLNQLWRNMLLAEQVALARQCDEFGFWVFSSTENDKYLWKNGATENQFREILTEQGNKGFKKIHLETILDMLKDIVVAEPDRHWLSGMEAKYRISLNV